VTLATLLTVPTVIDDLSNRRLWVAASNMVLVIAGVGFSFALKLRPPMFAVAVNILFALVVALSLVETALLGDLLQSGFAVVFGSPRHQSSSPRPQGAHQTLARSGKSSVRETNETARHWHGM